MEGNLISFGGDVSGVNTFFRDTCGHCDDRGVLRRDPIRAGLSWLCFSVARTTLPVCKGLFR